MKKKIILTGIPRSGSTFIWQIINNIGKFKLIRRHSFSNDGDITFVTYRDFRDVLCSWSESHDQTIVKVVQLRESASFTNYIADLLKQKKQHWGDSNYHFIKYEDYFPNNTKDLVKYIYKTLECSITTEECYYLCEKFSLTNAKLIAEKYLTFSKCDKKTNIHGKHITNNGKSGNWKKHIGNDEIMQIFQSLKKYLVEFNYETK